MEKWIEKVVSIKKVKKLLKNNIIEVSSPDGWVPIIKYIEKGEKKLYKVKSGKKEIFISENHLFETNKGWKFAKNLNDVYDTILMEESNKFEHFSIESTNKKGKIVDIEVNHPNHRYYTNGFSSHNTNLGKSLIMTSLGVDCILRNKNVLYVTCEMSEEKISERIMANIFDIDTTELKSLQRREFHDKFESIRKQVKTKFVIKEYPTKSINVNHIRNLVKELQVRKKFIPDIMFVDYLGIMNPIYRNKGDNTYLEVKRISEELRGFAVELGIPIISAVQVNRGGLGDPEIDLGDIADSFATTHTADIIIGVVQSDEFRKMGKYNWIILKNRYGLNKHVFAVNVDYYKMRISENTESLTSETASSITKIPPSEKEKQNQIDAVVQDVKDTLNKDLKDKFAKMIGKFDDID